MDCTKQKTTVIMHKANGGYYGYAVNRQTQKPHCHVAALCSLTALGFVAVCNLGCGAGVMGGKVVGCKQSFSNPIPCKGRGCGARKPQYQMRVPKTPHSYIA